MINFDELTEKQREVLGMIAINWDQMHHRKVIAALLAKELIVEEDAVLGGRFPVHIKRYYVPLHVHIQWCEWCSKQVED